MALGFAMRLAVGEMFRPEHDAKLRAPASWHVRDVARWLLALNFHRDGRADARIAADAIIPCAQAVQRSVPDGEVRPAVTDLGRMTPRERAAFALAMWESYSGPLCWSWDEIARAFAVDADEVASSMGHVAAELRAGVGKDCRRGMTEVRATVVVALAAKVAA